MMDVLKLMMLEARKSNEIAEAMLIEIKNMGKTMRDIRVRLVDKLS